MNVDLQLKTLSSFNVSFENILKGKSTKKNILPVGMKTFQVNVGKLCNQTCSHCHVDAGPKRTEIMNKETIDQCLKIIFHTPQIEIVDITGGAPEMNPHFHYLVEESKKADKHVIDRCNLTILEMPGYEHLYDFLAKNEVEIIASLPHFTESSTDKQRGKGVFQKSITALKKLNELGYGDELPLNLVYNPVGTCLSGCQEKLEKEFKQNLQKDFGVKFTNLYCLNNLPINRYLDSLVRTNKFNEYMQTLVHNFSLKNVEGLMCRDQVSVSWDGYIYDCDFNQMLEIKSSPISHIKQFNYKQFISRNIKTANHCFGCTAGSGSSCGGAISSS